MKVKELLSKIDSLKKSGKISDESEVLSYVGAIVHIGGEECLRKYNGDDMELKALQDTKLVSELGMKIKNCQHASDFIEKNLATPGFYDEEEKDLAELDLEQHKKKVKEYKRIAKRYNTEWKDALVI